MIKSVEHKRKIFSKKRKRSKKNIKLSVDRPRLTVYRSNKYLYVQVYDVDGKILCSTSSVSKELKSEKLGKNIESAKIVGKAIGEKLKKLKIEKVVFDRNGFLYHGKIEALANACREIGIKF